MKKVGKVIGYFFPKLKLTKQGTDDCKYYIQERPLNYNGRNIPGTIRIVLNAIEEIENSYSLFDTPYLLFQAGVDKLIDPFAPLDLEKSCKAKDKNTIYIKDMWHSIFYEREYTDMVEMSAEWLRTRI